jgi:hypothetical protein
MIFFIASHASHENVELIHGPCFQSWDWWVSCFHGCHVAMLLLYLRLKPFGSLDSYGKLLCCFQRKGSWNLFELARMQ